MTLTASTSVSCLHTPLTRALTWPNGTHDRHAGLLCDTAAYGKHGTRRRSRHFSNFGGNNHKYAAPSRVTIDYRDSGTTFGRTDFPAAPPTDAPTSSRSRLVVEADAVQRALLYAAAVPPAVAGQHGDVHTFRVCCRIARGFALRDDEALTVLREWNTRCDPPWSERELINKLSRARRYGREPIGGLLEKPP